MHREEKTMKGYRPTREKCPVTSEVVLEWCISKSTYTKGCPQFLKSREGHGTNSALEFSENMVLLMMS